MVQNQEETKVPVGELPRTETKFQKTVPFEEHALQGNVNSGANWFYWIAGLSLVNSVVYIVGGGLYFVVGLGITQLVEGFLSPLGTGGILFSLAFDIFVAGIFALFGLFARKGKNWAFITGMVLYFFDTLLFLLVFDVFSILFHLFALFQLFMGLRANLKLKKAKG
ncbi:hypothetical protein JW766_06800 [Candidatus Dojkabacteria bacterium]|nr:hypothetical protein [Candidatus Dojkabacteria bacterium]